MNVERFYAAMLQLQSAKQEYDFLSLLNNVNTSLSQSLSQPNQPQYGEAFKTHYSQLLNALNTQETLSPSFTTYKIFEELNVTDFFGDGLREWVESIFSENQITPANALTEFQSLIQKVTKFYTTVDALLTALEYLEVPLHMLDSGEAEIGVSIPKNIFAGELEALEREFHQIDRAFRPFKEMANDDTASMSVKAISASEWQVFLDMLPVSALAVAAGLERIAQLYKTNLEIKVLKQQLEEKKLPEHLTQEIQEHIENEISKGLSVIASDLVDEFYKGSDKPRQNELKAAIGASLSYLANRMDQGATVDVTMEPPETSGEGQEEGASPSSKDKKLLQIATAIKERMRGIVRIQALNSPPLGITVEPHSSEEAETPKDEN